MRKAGLGLAAVLLLTAGCDRKTSSPLETTTSEGQASLAPAGTAAAKKDRALVRFMNADPASSTSDFLAGDMPLFSGIAYKSMTPYVEIPSQATQFRAKLTAQSAVVAIHDELFAGRSYTYILIPGKGGKPFLAETSDDLSAPKPGTARVRIINATPDFDNLDLFAMDVNKKVGQRVRTGVVTEFKGVDPGRFEIHAPMESAAPQLSDLAVAPDRFYTFIIVGRRSEPDLVRVEERLTSPAPSE